MIITLYSLFTTNNLVEGFGFWLRLFQVFLIINMTILMILDDQNRLDKKKLNIILWCVLINAIIATFYILKQYYISGLFNLRRVPYAIHFSRLILAAMPFFLFKYSMSEKTSGKLLWVILIGLAALAIHKNLVKNSFVGMVILVIIWGFFYMRKNFFLRLLVPSIIILLLSILMISRPWLWEFYSGDTGKVLENILSGVNFYSWEPSLWSGRIGIWQVNTKYFANSPLINKLLGNGFDAPDKIFAETGRYFQYFVKYFYKGRIIYIERWDEHSNYVFYLSRTGLLGLFLYVLFILQLFKESFKLLRRTEDIYLRNMAQVFIAALFSYVIISFFDHFVRNVSFQYFFAVFAGFVIAANISEDAKVSKLKRETNAEQQK